MIKDAKPLSLCLLPSLSLLAATLLFAGLARSAESRPFYEGKTITLLISTSPGGATDVAGYILSLTDASSPHSHSMRRSARLSAKPRPSAVSRAILKVQIRTTIHQCA